jgi:hypothetical protein
MLKAMFYVLTKSQAKLVLHVLESRQELLIRMVAAITGILEYYKIWGILMF